MINVTCIPAQYAVLKNKKQIFEYYESKKDFYNMNFVSPDNGRLFNKDDVKNKMLIKKEKNLKNKKKCVLDAKSRVWHPFGNIWGAL